MNIFSAVNVLSSYPCVGAAPRNEISFFLVINCAEELISTPKVIIFWANLPLRNKKVPRESDLILHPEYLFLSISVFFVNLTAPNKQFSEVEIKLFRFELNAKQYICLLFSHDWMGFNLVLNNASQILLLFCYQQNLTISLQMTPIGVFLDYFSFSHFLATFCCLYKKRLSSLKSALNFASKKPIFCRLSVLVCGCAANQYIKLASTFQNF